MLKISVTILAKNAERTLRECLESVREFDEVILLDNQSTDQTQIIAQEFKNVRIYQSDFMGFGALKNLAVSYARNDWIFSLDSDEILEKEALEEIKKLPLDRGHYYSLLRKNHYKQEWIRGCGWHPDWVKRIFCKNEIAFRNDLVHEGLEIPKGFQEVRIKSGGIRHYTHQGIEQMIEKMNRYTTLSAKEKYKQGKRGSAWGAVFRFAFVFIKDYFFRFGWRYGYKGFMIAWCNAGGAMLRHLKLYELNNED